MQVNVSLQPTSLHGSSVDVTIANNHRNRSRGYGSDYGGRGREDTRGYGGATDLGYGEGDIRRGGDFGGSYRGQGTGQRGRGE